ncbi:hypothetical protein BH09PSE6_BH09PSE6_01440 [soil metagenome]
MTTLRVGAAIVLLAIAALAASEGRAQPSVQLKIETGGSAGLHRSIAEDPRSDRLYSVGDDRTVRVWRRSDLRLLDVWYAPISDAQPLEGELFSTDLSPDGRTLAAGGFTGYAADRTFCVYLFDTRFGQLRQRICGFVDSIGVLRYSRDGASLYVGLVGQGGLHRVDVQGARVVASDRAYRDAVLGLDFGPAGEVYSVSVDGWMRRYAPDLTLQGRVQAAQGARAARVRVAPGGERIAIGFQEGAVVAVYSGATGQPMQEVRAPPELRVRQFAAPAWSQDGRTLEIGATLESQEAVVLRWSGTPLAYEGRRTVGNKRFFEAQRLANGELGFTLEDGRIGVLGAQGAPRLTLDNGVPDFAHDRFRLRVDERAGRVGVPLGDGTALEFQPARVSARIATLAAAGPVRALPPGWKWRQGDESFTLDGRTHTLGEHEALRCVLALPDGSVLVGTEWGLHEVSRDGRMRRIARYNAPVRQLAYAPATGLVIAAFGDGRIRWVRRDDGRELLSLFVHLPTREWVAWTPGGFYASSPSGAELVGWVVTRDAEHEAEYYRAVQFEREYFQPQRIRQALDGRDRGALDARELIAIAPPRVRIESVQAAAAGDPDRALALRFSAERRGPPMLGFAVYIDDVPVVPSLLRPLCDGERDRVERVLQLPAARRDAVLRVEILTDRTIGFAEGLAPSTPRAALPAPGVLRVLAVGVNRFPNLPASLGLDLEFARKDAGDMARQLGSGGAQLYRSVEVRTVTDAAPGGATKASIAAALAFLADAGPDDTSILFLASHGATDDAGNFWFVPADASLADICALQTVGGARAPPECDRAGNAATPFASLVPWTTFFDGLRAAAGRRVLIVDTCEARGVAGGVEPASLRKRSASSRFALMLAAADGESSQEYAKGGNGLFTYSLLAALRGDGGVNRNADRRVTLHEVFDHAQRLVQQLHDPRAGPMTPSLIAPSSQMELPLMRVVP